uniref:GH16 domain-containing protein n=1 Tax=Oryza punctata TaxID=4537 RepID=A0A0E0K7Y3_ORYPU
MASESECVAVAELPRVHLHLHPDGTEPLAHIAVDYCPEACHHASEDGEIHVTYDDRGGSRWRSRCRFLPGGAVAATIRAPAGDTAGLNYNLYLSSLEGSRDMDEIDFEFLGHDKCAVQTNFHVAGGGGREQIHVLPFDSSDGFHHYAIAWGADAIEWRIDGELIRREERLAGEPWPEKPMFLYASVWDASHINDGKWTGTYHGRDAPYVCSYRDIRVPLALSLEDEEDPYQCACAEDASAATAAADAEEQVDAGDAPAATAATDAAEQVDAGDVPAAAAAADAVEEMDAGAGKD